MIGRGEAVYGESTLGGVKPHANEKPAFLPWKGRKETNSTSSPFPVVNCENAIPRFANASPILRSAGEPTTTRLLGYCPNLAKFVLRVSSSPSPPVLLKKRGRNIPSFRTVVSDAGALHVGTSHGPNS